MFHPHSNAVPLLVFLTATACGDDSNASLTGGNESSTSGGTLGPGSSEGSSASTTFATGEVPASTSTTGLDSSGAPQGSSETGVPSIASSTGEDPSGGSPVVKDGFEAGAVGAELWTPRINGNGTITVTAEQAHSGSSSLQVDGSSGFSTMLALEGAPLFPAPDNTFFGRVWLYVPEMLPANAHVIWIEAGSVENDGHEVRIGMNLGRLQTNLWLDGEVDIRAASSIIQADEWHCLTFKMGNDELEVGVDGVIIDAVSTRDWVAVDGQSGNQQPLSDWSPTYEAVRIGWELAGASIYYDDVAFGHAPIGCD